jgi:hypothetical protein
MSTAPTPDESKERLSRCCCFSFLAALGASIAVMVTSAVIIDFTNQVSQDALFVRLSPHSTYPDPTETTEAPDIYSLSTTTSTSTSSTTTLTTTLAPGAIGLYDDSAYIVSLDTTSAVFRKCNGAVPRSCFTCDDTSSSSVAESAASAPRQYQKREAGTADGSFGDCCGGWYNGWQQCPVITDVGCSALLASLDHYAKVTLGCVIVGIISPCLLLILSFVASATSGRMIKSRILVTAYILKILMAFIIVALSAAAIHLLDSAFDSPGCRDVRTEDSAADVVAPSLRDQGYTISGPVWRSWVVQLVFSLLLLPVLAGGLWVLWQAHQIDWGPDPPTPPSGDSDD